jgi:hypothetical protein
MITNQGVKKENSAMDLGMGKDDPNGLEETEIRRFQPWFEY